MNFGQMKRALRRLVDRPDMTDLQASDLVQRAIANLERSPVRLGFQKTTVHAEMDGVSSALSIPGNLLEPIDLYTDTATYSLVVLATWQRRKRDRSRQPSYIAQGQSYLLTPTPGRGTLVHLHYYAEAEKVSVDADENVWLKSGTEAVLYTAARMAADDFQIDEGAKWQAQADREILLLQDQDSSEEWAGDMAIELPHVNIC